MSDDTQRHGDQTNPCLSLFARYVEDVLDGKTIDIQQIRTEHPEYASELIEQLRTFIGTEDDESTGNRFGDYVLVKPVGRGGMGAVYEAWQDSLNRRVALKLLPIDARLDSHAVARFTREAQLSAKLSHENIVAVHGMGVENSTPYFAMEFIEGQTLANFFSRQVALRKPQSRSGSLSDSKADLHYCVKIARAFVGVAEGLEHAHQHGITHRDIKPSNLMFDRSRRSEKLPDGALRILDFGIARIEGAEQLTHTGDLIGTVRYMSPEQASPSDASEIGTELGSKSDIYSVGVTLYESITLTPLIDGKDMAETLRKIVELDPVAPRRINPRIPVDLETIILKCLRKAPEDRYATAGDLAKDLRRFVAGDAIAARPQSMLAKIRRLASRHGTSLTMLVAILVLGLLVLRKTVEVRNARRNSSVAEQQIRVLEYGPTVQSGLRSMRQADLSFYIRAPQELSMRPWGFDHYGTAITDVTTYLLTDPSIEGKKRLELAVEEFSKAEQTLSDVPDAYWHRARAYVLLQRDDEAIRDLEMLLELSPKSVPGWMLLSALHRRAGRMQMANGLVARGEQAAASGWQQHWLKAHRYAQSLRWALAADEFTRALEAAGDAEPYIGWQLEQRQCRQIAYQQAGQYVAALQEITLLRDRWPEATDLRVAEGTTYYALGGDHQSRAFEIFEDLYDHGPNRSEVAEIVCTQHSQLVRQRRVPPDQQLIEKWSARIRDPAVREYVVARFLFSQGRRVEGRARLQQAIAIAPQNAWLHYELGCEYLLTEQAGSFLRKAVELDPAVARFHAVLAFFEASNGSFDTARREVRLCEKYGPRGKWDFVYLGLALGYLGEHARADRLFDQALQQDLDPWVDHNRGKMLFRSALRSEGKARELLLRKSIASHQNAVRKHRHFDFYGLMSSAHRLLGEKVKAFEADVNIIELRRMHFGAHSRVREILGTPSHLPLKGAARILRDRLVATLPELPTDDRRRVFLQTLVDTHVYLGEVDEAKEAARRLITLYSTLSVPSPPRQLQTARSVLDPEFRTFACIDAKLARVEQPSDIPEVLESFIDFAKRDPSDRVRSELLDYALARQHQLLDQPGKALASLERIAASATQPEPVLRVAQCQLAVDSPDLDRAFATLEKGLLRFPSDHRLWALWWNIRWEGYAQNASEIRNVAKRIHDRSGSQSLFSADDVDWLLRRVQSGEPIQLNCGATEPIQVDGVDWSQDRFFEPSRSGRILSTVKADRFAKIYETQRGFAGHEGRAYRIPLPTGRYRVRLYLAEGFFAFAGERRFSVIVEGQAAVSNFDTYAVAGLLNGHEVELSAEVDDGLLDIEFVPEIDIADVSGISVEPIAQ